VAVLIKTRRDGGVSLRLYFRCWPCSCLSSRLRGGGSCSFDPLFHAALLFFGTDRNLRACTAGGRNAAITDTNSGQSLTINISERWSSKIYSFSDVQAAGKRVRRLALCFSRLIDFSRSRVFIPWIIYADNFVPISSRVAPSVWLLRSLSQVWCFRIIASCQEPIIYRWPVQIKDLRFDASSVKWSLSICHAKKRTHKIGFINYNIYTCVLYVCWVQQIFRRLSNKFIDIHVGFL